MKPISSLLRRATLNLRLIPCVGGPLDGRPTVYAGRRKVVNGGEYRVESSGKQAKGYSNVYRWYGGSV